jgi:hypothetical protein
MSILVDPRSLLDRGPAVNVGYHRVMSTGLGQSLAPSFSRIISPSDEAEPRFRCLHIDTRHSEPSPR